MEERIVIQKKPPKSPVAAGILAGFFPFGVGAMYNGLYSRGLAYLFVFAGLVTLQGHGKGQPFLGILLGGLYFYQIVESIQTAAAINRRALSGKDEPVPIEEQLLEPVKAGSIFWGAVLVVLGGLLLLANFNVLDYDTLFDFWPLAVIGLGIKLVFDHFARAKKG